MAAELSNVILSRHPDMPMKALWEALNDTAIVGPEVAMGIVNDPRCGIERRSEVKEGRMQNSASNLMLKGGATPLILSALACRDDVMAALLSLNAAVDAKEDRIGNTALHVSACVNNVSAIGMLITKGSDVEAVDKNGCTPLHTAASDGKLEAIELLIAKGSDMMAVDEDGYTPLHIAALLEKLEVIEMLTGNGSDVKAVLKNGDTPLHIAARNGNIKAMVLLIAKGSDTEAVNKDGHTPLSYLSFHVGLTA